MTELWAKVRAKFIEEEEEQEEESLLQQWGSTIDEATTLSRMQRLYGFLICAGMAVLFTFLSAITFFPFFNPLKFVVMYSFSNLFALGGTMFLMGPMAQLRRMFDKGRWVATTMYLLSLAATLAAAFLTHNGLLVLIFLMFQITAYIWYCLSYIPFARSLASKFMAWFTSEG